MAAEFKMEPFSPFESGWTRWSCNTDALNGIEQVESQKRAKRRLTTGRIVVNALSLAVRPALSHEFRSENTFRTRQEWQQRSFDGWMTRVQHLLLPLDTRKFMSNKMVHFIECGMQVRTSH